MFTLFLNFNIAQLGLNLTEPFIVLLLSLFLVVTAGLARYFMIKGVSPASKQAQGNLSIHTSQIGEKTT
jgi:hypothetical protein